MTDDEPLHVTADQHFVILPEWMIPLHPRAVQLYCALRSYADTDGVCWPSRRTLSEWLTCSVDTIDRATRALVDAGAVRVESRHDARGQTSNGYVLLSVTPAARARPPRRKNAAPPAAETRPAPPQKCGTEVEPREVDPLNERGAGVSTAREAGAQLALVPSPHTRRFVENPSQLADAFADLIVEQFPSRRRPRVTNADRHAAQRFVESLNAAAYAELGPATRWALTSNDHWRRRLIKFGRVIDHWDELQADYQTAIQPAHNKSARQTRVESGITEGLQHFFNRQEATP